MISVCMATYNGERYIREQVTSILQQLSSTDELIVSDDGSTDTTLKIVEAFCDSRIHIFHNTVGHGVIDNFENSLRQAKGDFIFLADQDDVWLPGKVEKCIDYLTSADLVLHDACIVDMELKVLYPSFFELRPVRQGMINNLIKNSYIGCCLAFKKNILDFILPFPKKIAMHDMWIGLQAERHFRVCFLKENLLLYRRHGENVSPTAECSGLSFKNKVLYRLRMIKYILFE